MDFHIVETNDRHTLEAFRDGVEVNLVTEFDIFGFEYDNDAEAWQCDQESFDWIAEIYEDYEEYLDVSEGYGRLFDVIIDDDWWYLDLEVRFKEAVDRYRKDEAWRTYNEDDLDVMNVSQKTKDRLMHFFCYINEEMPRAKFADALMWKEYFGNGNEAIMAVSLDRKWMISYAPRLDLFEATGDIRAARKWLGKIVNDESRPEPTSFWADDLP